MTIAAFEDSPSDLTTNSWNLLRRPTGRLSTQKKPRSSRARRKVPFPEPLRPVMMIKEDGCTSRFRLDPTDIPVLSLVDDVQPLRVRIPEDQEFAVGAADFDSRIVDAHRFCRDFVH